MFCPKCGAEIPSEASFCMNCGCNIREFIEKSFSKASDAKSENDMAQQYTNGHSHEYENVASMEILDKSKDYYLSAKKMLAQNESELALSAIRNSLESYVKQLCRKSAIEFDSRESTLETMINSLFESNVVDSRDRDLMHGIRKECNKGSHVDIDGKGPELEIAETAMDYLESLFDERRIVGSISQTQQAAAQNNVPMTYPDYLSSKRRFYGKWSDCMEKSQLLINPDYVELKRKAEEDEDVDAMLNLATGFLSQNIDWNNNMLINMPGIMYRGEYYIQPNSYNSRYYHWVIRAVGAAYRKWCKGEYFSKKYLLSAIWETWIALFYVAYNCFDEEVLPELYYGKYLRPDKWKEKNYIIDVESEFDDDSKQYIYKPIYGYQDALYGSISDSIRDNIPFVDFPLPEESFLDFSREMFFGAPDHVVAPIYVDAQDFVAEKIDLMYFLIKAVRSEETWLLSVLREKENRSIFKINKNVDVGEAQFFQYTEKESAILSYDQIQLNNTVPSTFSSGNNMIVDDFFEMSSYLGPTFIEMCEDAHDRINCSKLDYIGERFIKKYIKSKGLDISVDMI